MHEHDLEKEWGDTNLLQEPVLEDISHSRI